MVKLDNRLLKYSVMIIIIYFLVSKVPLEQQPGNNPLLLTGIISVVLYILDQPNILFENFEHDQQMTMMSKKQSQEGSNEHKQREQNTFDKNMLKSIVREIVNENKKNDITTTTVTVADNVKEHFEPAPAPIAAVKKDDAKESSIINMLANGLPTTAKIVSDAITATKAEKCDCEETANKAIVKFLQGRRLLDNNGMLHYADAYIGDMGYSQIKLDKYIPMGANGDGAYDSWDLAQYNIINTDRWKPPTEMTPHCKSDVAPPEVQAMDSRAPLNLMNFDYSRKVMPPSNINTKYITERLNA